MLEDMSMNNIKKEDNKVNLYMFWGNGCPYCYKMKDFIDSLDNLKDKYNLYTFESWYNQENAFLLSKFASYLNHAPDYVPYLIIGKQVFTGYNPSMDEKIINAIHNTLKEPFDIYEETK